MIHLVIVALMAFGISCSVRGNAEKGGVETGSPVAAAAQSYLPEATTPEGLYREGGRLCRKGRNADALTTYRALIERFPEQNRAGCAAIYLAGLQLSGKNYQEAIETLTLAAEKYDQDRYGDGVEVGGYAYFLLAKAYCETGEYEKAAASLRNLVDKFPYASGHRSGDALMSIRAKRWFYDTLTENGIDLSFLDNLIARQKEPENFHLLTARQLALVGHICGGENEPDKAIAAFTLLAWKYPNESFTAEACLAAGELQLERKQYDGALESARTLMERFPDVRVGKGGPLKAMGFFNTGAVHIARREYREAGAAFETVARDYPPGVGQGGRFVAGADRRKIWGFSGP